jgi:hypothetical protein
MAFVQGAHGGHQAEQAVAAARVGGDLLHPRNSVN